MENFVLELIKQISFTKLQEAMEYQGVMDCSILLKEHKYAELVLMKMFADAIKNKEVEVFEKVEPKLKIPNGKDSNFWIFFKKDVTVEDCKQIIKNKISKDLTFIINILTSKPELEQQNIPDSVLIVHIVLISDDVSLYFNKTHKRTTKIVKDLKEFVFDEKNISITSSD